ncbi:MAG TPA: flagellar hook-basal body complex protein FliE [Acidocella sp.]|nr:flagellar hook-basal body complex protein FliE [Acidocella sp.]
MTIASITPALGTLAAGGGQPVQGGGSAGNFLDMVNSALQGVSNAQGQAASAEAAYAVGAPGATLGQAVVASDRAEVAWNATVAVRNEVVSAYSSIMNMQF